MKKRLLNAGFSLIELVISIALVTIIGGSIITFLLTGTNSYSAVSKDVDLQEEAQIVTNQLSDFIVDTDRAITFKEDADKKELTIYNKDEKQLISYEIGGDKIYYSIYKRKNGTVEFIPYVERALLAEMVSDFLVTIYPNGSPKLKINLILENGNIRYEKKETITPRNKIIFTDDLNKIYEEDLITS